MRPTILVAGWLLGWLLLWRPPVLGRPRAGRGAHRVRRGETVAVVVPARDEADRLPLLLRSLRDQDLPIDEVVVVDDHSRDATRAVASAAPGVRVVAAPPLPAGWTGKSWACHVGVRATTAQVVVLLDADVVLARRALSLALAERRRTGGLVSVQPRHDVARPVEALSLLFNVVAVMGLGIATPLRRGPEWGAAGPLLVTSRRDYDATGGHAAVSGDVAEDLGLARRFRGHGLPVRCLLGGGLVRFRMYRDLRGLVGGWRKNMATGARRTPLVLAAATALWISALITAAGWIAGSLGGSGGALALAAGCYALVAVQVAVLGRVVGRFGPAAALWPVLVATFVVVVAWSALSTFVLHRVTWADRTIDLTSGARGAGVGAVRTVAPAGPGASPRDPGSTAG